MSIVLCRIIVACKRMRFSKTEEVGRMRTVDAHVAAQSLSRLVDQVRQSGDSIRISTPNGSIAVLMSVDEFDSLQETMISLAQPGTREELAQADGDYGAGRTVSGDELRVRYGLSERRRKRSSPRE
jgi:antitoxin YefM